VQSKVVFLLAAVDAEGQDQASSLLYGALAQELEKKYVIVCLISLGQTIDRRNREQGYAQSKDC
jgi:hypothetical protein